MTKQSLKLAALALGFILAACASVPQEPVVEIRSIECVHPERTTKFKWAGFTHSEVKNGTIILTSSQDVVYYALPVGYACRETSGEQQ